MAVPTPKSTHLQIASDSNFKNIVLNDDGAYRTSRNVASSDKLPADVPLYARVRHRANNVGGDGELVTNWSKTTNFTVESEANIIGVCCDNSNPKAKGTWNWIDRYGNKVDSFDFHNHPTFSNIKVVTMDTERDPCEMVTIPTFYIKTAVNGVASTFSNGKKCWWLSDRPALGFRPHPTFKRSTQQTNGKYKIAPSVSYGRYLGHEVMVNGKLSIGSKKGQKLSNTHNLTEYKSMADARNDIGAGISGYRIFDMYDVSCIRYLALMGAGSPNDKEFWYPDAKVYNSIPLSGDVGSDMVFKGTHSKQSVSLCDISMVCWIHTQYLTFNSYTMNYQLISSMDGTSRIKLLTNDMSKVGFHVPVGINSYLRDVANCQFVLGNDTHDIMEFFVPNGYTLDRDLSTYSTICRRDFREQDHDTGGVGYFAFSNNWGSPASNQYMCGVFFIDDLVGANTKNIYNSSRLAKQ